MELQIVSVIIATLSLAFSLFGIIFGFYKYKKEVILSTINKMFFDPDVIWVLDQLDFQNQIHDEKIRIMFDKTLITLDYICSFSKRSLCGKMLRNRFAYILKNAGRNKQFIDYLKSLLKYSKDHNNGDLFIYHFYYKYLIDNRIIHE